MSNTSDTNVFPNFTGIPGKIPLGEIGIQDKSGEWHFIRELKSPNTSYRYFEDRPGEISQVTFPTFKYFQRHDVAKQFTFYKIIGLDRADTPFIAGRFVFSHG